MRALNVTGLGRPVDVIERTRWLFLWLCVITLLTALPAPFAIGGVAPGLLATGCGVILAGSWWLGYRLRRVPLALDLVDAAAYAGFVLACSKPTFVITAVFAALWYRSLYGSTWRAIARGWIFLAGFGAASHPLWQFGLGPGHDVANDPGALFGMLPSVFLTIAVGVTLGKSIAEQGRAARRDGTLVELGRRLLGLTDREAISRLAWESAVDLCGALPGVRLLKVTADQHTRLHIDGLAGQFPRVTTELPIGLLSISATGSADDEAAWQVADVAALNRTVGVTLAWTVVALPDADVPSWLLIGAPRAVPTAAVVAIRGLVNQVTLAFQASHAHRQLAVQARTDTLTGLANRIVFTEALAVELESSGRPTAVLFIDIDDFKHVNDGLGHQAGDELLQEIARRLGRATRSHDLVARLGGDEFAVILRHTQPEIATSVATRIVAAVATPVPVSNGVAEVGASVGVAMAEPGCGLDELVRRADVAMYAAKAQGKNQVQPFHPSLLPVERSVTG